MAKNFTDGNKTELSSNELIIERTGLSETSEYSSKADIILVDDSQDAFNGQKTSFQTEAVIHYEIPTVRNAKTKKKTIEQKMKTARVPKINKARFKETPMFHDPLLPLGWTRKLTQRQSGKSAGAYDVYIYSPEGKKFRSKIELAVHLASINSDLRAEDFDFSICGRGSSSTQILTKIKLQSIKNQYEEFGSESFIKKRKVSSRTKKANLAMETPEDYVKIEASTNFECPKHTASKKKPLNSTNMPKVRKGRKSMSSKSEKKIGKSFKIKPAVKKARMKYTPPLIKSNALRTLRGNRENTDLDMSPTVGTADNQNLQTDVSRCSNIHIPNILDELYDIFSSQVCP